MKNKKICILVGSMAVSGGTYVIIQHASYLRSICYDVTLAVQEPITLQMLSWHDLIAQLRCIPIEVAKAERFDLVIATWWKTALELGSFNSDRFGYFVQSIESKFYSSSEKPLQNLVDSTYALPVNFATEATWIKEYLLRNHGQRATLIKNGIRKDVYTVEGDCLSKKTNGRPRILIEGPFGVPFKNTALSICLAKKAGFDDIWVLTGSDVSWIPGVAKVFSRIPMNQTAKIYRSCDILLKLSTVEGMFGPPLEMFHCGGTAVVFDVSGHDEYIVDGLNACVIKQGDLNGVVNKLKELLADRNLITRLKDGAKTTAKSWPGWSHSSSEFEKWVGISLRGQAVARDKLERLNKNALAQYHRDEKSNLNHKSQIFSRKKLRVVAGYLPSSFIRKIKQFNAIAEVLFGGKEVF